VEKLLEVSLLPAAVQQHSFLQVLFAIYIKFYLAVISLEIF